MENRLPDSFTDRLYRTAVQQSPDWLWLFDAAGTPIGVSPAHNAGELYMPRYSTGIYRGFKTPARCCFSSPNPLS